MTSNNATSFSPQIVRVPASPLSPEAHEAHETHPQRDIENTTNNNDANNNNNSELSDIDLDSDFEYEYQDVDDHTSRDKFQPDLSWASAAEDASNGVQYVKEKFPGENIPYLPSPFRQEPIKVEVDDKVVVLDEVSEHAVRVKLVRTGEVGIVPMWNVEGPFERLARQNMLWNEIATSPTVEKPTTIDSIKIPPRRRYSTDEEELDPDWPLTPTSPTTTFLASSSTSPVSTRRPSLLLSPPTVYSIEKSSTNSTAASPPFRLKRKVEFSSSPRKIVFRYFPPNEPQSQWDSDSDSDSGSGEPTQSQASGSEDPSRSREEDSNWWWDGWEELHEDEEEGEEEEEVKHIDLDKERERWRAVHRQRGFIVA